MRTTVRLDEQLLKEIKRHALATGKTLTKVIEDALRESLARQRQCKTNRTRIHLTTTGKGGLCEGVDLDDSARLLEVMEGDNAAA